MGLPPSFRSLTTPTRPLSRRRPSPSATTARTGPSPSTPLPDAALAGGQSPDAEGRCSLGRQAEVRALPRPRRRRSRYEARSRRAPHRATPWRLDAQPGGSRERGGPAGVDSVDDLGVVDALEIDRRDAEVRVAELALDDVQ